MVDCTVLYASSMVKNGMRNYIAVPKRQLGRRHVEAGLNSCIERNGSKIKQWLKAVFTDESLLT